MVYQTLTEKIENILHCTPLKKPERAILLQSYMNPGVSQIELKEVGQTKSLTEQMIRDGLLLKKREGGKDLLYPLPLALLFKKYAEERMLRDTKALQSLQSIDQWIQYPFLRSRNVHMKFSESNQTVLKWLFELHAVDWERVFCFGDYESFIEAIGMEAEQDWIHERMNKGRSASVVATQDGKWAQHIRKVSEKELRNCLIDPRDFSDMFIMAFPDIQTTVIGTNENEMTFIHSKTVANTYAELVERCMV